MTSSGSNSSNNSDGGGAITVQVIERPLTNVRIIVVVAKFCLLVG